MAQARLAGRASAVSIPQTLRPIPRIPESAATITRTITLNEYQDKVGNSMVMLLNRKHWHEPVTETPKLNSTEIWEFVNLTEDTHPMHLHLVRFQILDRRPFDTFDYLMHKKLRFTAPPPRPSPTNSAGRTPSSALPARSPASSSASRATPANTSTTATSSSTKPTT